MDSKYDFSGWATKFGVRCSDGRTIWPGAFNDNDGGRVPLVWNHDHTSPEAVIGHADLVSKKDGVYAYCSLNDTDLGKTSRILIEHGDVNSLSICANKLQESSGNVTHGLIREVSLVLAGANPGAYIENVIEHGEELCDCAIIYSGEDIQLASNDDSEIEHSESSDSVEHSDSGDSIEHSDESKDTNVANDSDDNGKTVRDVYNSMTDEQKDVVALIVGQAIADATGEDSDEDDDMKHNVFENDNDGGYICHADLMKDVMQDVRQGVNFEEAVLQHADDYGIQDIETLFPEPTDLNMPPEYIKRDDSWVSQFMNNVHHTPYSRIRSRFADITEDEARARGYIKGKLKKEEVFTLLKRVTTPATIYKKQKFDRDDLIDITDFDVIAMIRQEMRMMLDEEIARACLLGDGRSSASDDKISEDHIRPVWTDDDLFTIKTFIKYGAADTADQKARSLIRAMIKARKNYKGSGNPTFWTTEDVLTDCLLIEDTTGRRLYNDVSDVARAMRVSNIVTVELMEDIKHTVNVGADGTKETELLGIMVNPRDYNVGTDKGGAIQMYDAFDIDYNQQKYLLETRMSGALIKPYSAISVEAYTA